MVSPPDHFFASWLGSSENFIYQSGENIRYRDNTRDEILLRGREATSSPDGNMIVFKDISGLVWFYDLSNNTLRRTTVRCSDYCVWSPNGKQVLCLEARRTMSCTLSALLALVPATNVTFRVIDVKSGSALNIYRNCGGTFAEYGWLETSLIQRLPTAQPLRLREDQ